MTARFDPVAELQIDLARSERLSATDYARQHGAAMREARDTGAITCATRSGRQVWKVRCGHQLGAGRLCLLPSGHAAMCSPRWGDR